MQHPDRTSAASYLQATVLPAALAPQAFIAPFLRVVNPSRHRWLQLCLQLTISLDMSTRVALGYTHKMPSSVRAIHLGCTLASIRRARTWWFLAAARMDDAKGKRDSRAVADCRAAFGDAIYRIGAAFDDSCDEMLTSDEYTALRCRDIADEAEMRLAMDAGQL